MTRLPRSSRFPHRSITVYLQFQVNANNLGRRSQDVRFYDDTELLATVQRDVTIWP